MSLVLKLGPRERVMINGVVMENGDRRTRLQIVTPDAKVLRLRDAIHPDQVTTPVRRVAYVAQLVLAGEAEPEEGRRQILRGIEQLAQVFCDEESRLHLDEALRSAIDGRIYQAMRALRMLLPREALLLGVAPDEGRAADAPPAEARPACSPRGAAPIGPLPGARASAATA